MKVVHEVREGKDGENCTRITVGGNLICYPGDTGTNTASLELIKLMLNSVISRKGAQFACIVIKNFYVDTPMEDPEYVRIKITDIPELFWSTGLLGRMTSMGGSILKFTVVAMGCPRQAFWPIISSASDWKRRYTTKPTILLDFGNTSGVRSNFASSLMTLALSTWAASISTTSPCS
jgi:hypothetical protein